MGSDPLWIEHALVQLFLRVPLEIGLIAGDGYAHASRYDYWCDQDFLQALFNNPEPVQVLILVSNAYLNDQKALKTKGKRMGSDP